MHSAAVKHHSLSTADCVYFQYFSHTATTHTGNIYLKALLDY
jgi:hypothetical protein